MNNPISLEQRAKLALTQKQTQRLMMSPHMQQAIQLLQLPVMELSTLIDEELERNPILEYLQEEAEEAPKEEPEKLDQEVKIDDRNFEILKQLDQEYSAHFAETSNPYNRRSTEDEQKQSYWENSIKWESTLFEHLMLQAGECFGEGNEILMAEQIIGSLDERGYLTSSLEQIAKLNQFEIQKLCEVLKMIQTFDPVGIGASDLRESLLIQLRSLGKEDTIAYLIVKHSFDDLLHNRWPLIKKKLDCSTEEIQEAVEHHITLLDLHPGTTHSTGVVQAIVPDAYLYQEEEKLIVVVNENEVPPLRLNRRYLKMLEEPNLTAETREYIQNKVLSAKWLMRTLSQRNGTLYRIVESLSERQRQFFVNPKGDLVPLTMKVIAEELDLHESTIARTVANKYLECPRGLLPLRFFFTNAYETAEGTEISSKKVHEVLRNIIDEEDKLKPFSDESISKLLNRRGIKCARRTVAKIRSILNIGNTRQRKKHQ